MKCYVFVCFFCGPCPYGCADACTCGPNRLCGDGCFALSYASKEEVQMISCCCCKETYHRVDHVTVNVQPRALGVAPDRGGGGGGGGGGAPAADMER